MKTTDKLAVQDVIVGVVDAVESAPRPSPASATTPPATPPAWPTWGGVANHDGNLSAGGAPTRFVCTPAATHKSDVKADGLVITDASGRQLGGRGKPFSECALHLAAFKSSPRRRRRRPRAPALRSAGAGPTRCRRRHDREAAGGAAGGVPREV